MDWNQLGQAWRSQTAPVLPADALDATRQRDRTLRRTVRRRDALETGVALLLLPVFAPLAWRLVSREEWPAAAFALLLVAWIAFVPWQLWRSRRRLPVDDPSLPLRAHLERSRDAMLAQARMLERVWAWYLAPCAVGVVGLSLSMRGVDAFGLAYAAIVLGFCVVLHRANRAAAHTQFRAHAEAIDACLLEFDQEHFSR